MLVDDILSAAGIPYRKTRFLQPQTGDYIVYNDSIETDGGDRELLLYRHSITAEVYTSAPAPETEARLETAFAENGVHFEKQEAFWLQKDQRYQTVYEFEYIEKRRA